MPDEGITTLKEEQATDPVVSQLICWKKRTGTGRPKYISIQGTWPVFHLEHVRPSKAVENMGHYTQLVVPRGAVPEILKI